MKKTLFLWIFILVSLLGKANPIDSIFVEYGGGMTVRGTRYKIVKNTIQKSNYSLIRSEGPFTVSVSAKQLKEIYTTSKKLLKSTEGFEKPGNMYKIIILYSKGKQVKYNWGEVSFDPPKDVKDLFDQILSLTKELKFQ